MLSIWRQQLKLYVVAALIGALIGVVLLAPSYHYISASKISENPLSSVEYMSRQILYLLIGNLSDDDATLMLFYAEIGAILGIVSLLLYKFLHDRFVQIDYLKVELDKDLLSIIRQGESMFLEFKSSLRWDMVEGRTNQALESVVLKTLAGFLNSPKGGTLLIGVADNGEILGLEKDYQTLKKPNQDGFEQSLITAVAVNLGSDVCQFVHVLFHVVDDKEVCRVIVSPAARPVFLEQNNSPKFFVRTGGGTRDLNVKEAVDYIFNRWQYSK